MKIPYVLFLIILTAACGDIIKTKDPRPGRKPYQPITLTDQTGSCPYYPGFWSGRCTGENHNPERTYPLDVAQTGCTLFALNSVAIYDLLGEKSYRQGEKDVLSTAAWLNTERTQLKLVEQWSAKEGTFERTVTLDRTKSEAVEQLKLQSADGQTTEVHSCFFQRS